MRSIVIACSGGSARSGHTFLLARFVVIFCGGHCFSGDGVLVMSSCDLLLVGGLEQRVFGVSGDGSDCAGVVGGSIGASVSG